jgi:alpha-tubulin suppressor-like RCC1 family protein
MGFPVRSWPLVIVIAVGLSVVGVGPVWAGPPVDPGTLQAPRGSVDQVRRPWVNVSTGGGHSCGVRRDRSLWCWGYNARGQLGLGGTRDRLVPTQVGSDRDWVKVSPGGDQTCGVRRDRSLWCWGRNDLGQLGLGDTEDRHVPTQVGSDRDWVKVSLDYGNHTCGIRLDRSLWCWGSNFYGQLGLGDTTNRLVPTQVGDDRDWVTASAGNYHTCGVRVDRSLWCWGRNDRGQLGLGDTTDRHVPTQVGSALGDWVEVSTGGGSHTCGVRRDRSLWCWGYNRWGQLGLGDTEHRHVPTQVGSDRDWAKVSTGNYYSCGVRVDRSLWCWGHNDYGQLGLGSTKNRRVPTRVGGDPDWVKASAGGWHTCGVRVDRSLWCWGHNDRGQLGLSDTRDRHGPTRV